VEVGRLVGHVVAVTGRRGPVLVEEGKGFGLEYEIGRGVRFDSGYASSLFVTDPARQEAVLPDSRVVLVSGRVPDNVADVVGSVLTAGEGVVVVCEELSHSALTGLVKLGESRPVLAVVADQDRLIRIHDVVGGTILDVDLLGTAASRSFGRAEKVVATARETLVYDGRSRTGNPAGLIRAATSEVPKVERAVRAVRSAAHEGVLRGGGVGLAELGARLALDATGTPEEVAGWQAFAAALAEPAARVAENAALTVADLDPALLDSAGVVRVIVTAASRTASRFLLVG
jgi:chaperonin GroEL